MNNNNNYISESILDSFLATKNKVKYKVELNLRKTSSIHIGEKPFSPEKNYILTFFLEFRKKKLHLIINK